MRTNHALPQNVTASCPSVFSAECWALPREAVQDLGDDLRAVWQRYHDCFVARRHDTSSYAFIYLKGLMFLPHQRNYANIARRVIDPESDGQNLQQFMSDSPWSAQAVFERLQADPRADHRLQSGMLNLDESGDIRAGDQSAGAAHQYIGNVGKVAMGQVGVAISYMPKTTGRWWMPNCLCRKNGLMKCIGHCTASSTSRKNAPTKSSLKLVWH